MPAGRPTDYNQELIAEICKRVSLGGNLDKITREEGMPAKETVYRWLRQNKEFSDEYALARAARADSRSDRIDDYVGRMLAGEIPSDVARVAIDAEKWQAGKEKPKGYGDKVEMETTTTHKLPDGIAEVFKALNIKKRD